MLVDNSTQKKPFQDSKKKKLKKLFLIFISCTTALEHLHEVDENMKQRMLFEMFIGEFQHVV